MPGASAVAAGSPGAAAPTAAGGGTERASNWATSTTSRLSLASPEAFLAPIASPSMTRQYGHAVDTVSGSVPSASSIRSVLIRLPIRSSIHIRAPPAPQQNPRSLHRCISCGLDPGHLLHDLPGRAEHLVVPAEEARVVIGDLLVHRA